MLYVVGLGLGDERDITVKGLEAVKGAKRVYLEAYTSILGVDKDRLEAFYGREVLLADRDFVEQGADEMLEGADTEDVVLLVVGDPFGATTHSDFVIRAREKNIPVQVVHNASIMNAVGCCGLQLYTYGEAVSIVFFTDDWRPDSFYDKIKYNRNGGLHTLCLLASANVVCRGRKIYEPPRFMTINQAVDQLLEIEEKRGEKVYDEDTLCVGLARVGQPTQKIVAGRMGSMRDVDFGGPLHSFVIAGKCHDLELEALLPFALDRDYIKGLMKH